MRLFNFVRKFVVVFFFFESIDNLSKSVVSKGELGCLLFFTLTGAIIYKVKILL